jgi:hypothetical protein
MASTLFPAGASYLIPDRFARSHPVPCTIPVMDAAVSRALGNGDSLLRSRSSEVSVRQVAAADITSTLQVFRDCSMRPPGSAPAVVSAAASC